MYLKPYRPERHETKRDCLIEQNVERQLGDLLAKLECQGQLVRLSGSTELAEVLGYPASRRIAGYCGCCR